MPSAALHVGPIDGSALALEQLHLDKAGERIVEGDTHDSLLYVASGSGALALDGTEHRLQAGSAALVLAGERSTLSATGDHLAVVLATVGADADRHAPLGRRSITTSLDAEGAEKATGARSFQVLFGPRNGSTRDALRRRPPARRPGTYHLYDEIVWVPRTGRLRSATTRQLGPGSAFRLRPRQVHIVENASAGHDLTIIGIFTPAGSPSAAYLTPDVAAEYHFAG